MIEPGRHERRGRHEVIPDYEVLTIRDGSGRVHRRELRCLDCGRIWSDGHRCVDDLIPYSPGFRG